ncbi:hypothetical protein SteCoe_36066 [Stentor coeruleus]|uniref:Uncharacterized protein n=1 Tax=Stentor coeruleus TaxID=5963 RepID=A0A1R2AQY1_9CILI|nr:hypothetical protein SteCoe_36066 [Stentor coeruleus]
MYTKSSQHNIPTINTPKSRKNTLNPIQSPHSHIAKTQRATKLSIKNSKNIENRKRISESISEPSTETSNNDLKYSEKTKKISNKVIQSLNLLKSVSSSLINPNNSLNSENSEAVLLSPAPRPNDILATSQNYDRRLNQNIYESLKSLKSSIEILERRVVSTEEMVKVQCNEEKKIKAQRLDFKNIETGLLIEDNESLVVCRACNIF